MIAYHPRRGPRRGFTLIELLVVMAIIAVLISLLMSGVMAAMQARDRTTTKFEIGKLDEGMKTAMKTYGDTKTLPGKLVLYNNIDVYRQPTAYGLSGAPLQDANRTKDALRRMFGARLLTNASTASTVPPYKGVNWDGSGNYGNPTALTAGPATTLEGQQCLVFYLGGMATVSGPLVKMNGFSIDPLDPSTAGGERIGPFYEFPSRRLAGGFGAPAGFYNFIDPYGVMPYAYFGGTGSANSYLDFCPTMGVKVYYEDPPTGLPTKYSNPNSFQIISAGRDKQFAPGGWWNPRAGNTDPRARDDLSNFSTAVLAAPQS